MSFCNMAYVLLCLECHIMLRMSHAYFRQVSAKLEHFENLTFEPLKLFNVFII